MGTKTYTKKFINSRFVIKIYGKFNGVRVNSYFGVSGAINLLGEDLFFGYVERALESKEDVTVCALRPSRTRQGVKTYFFNH